MHGCRPPPPKGSHEKKGGSFKCVQALDTLLSIGRLPCYNQLIAAEKLNWAVFRESLRCKRCTQEHPHSTVIAPEAPVLICHWHGSEERRRCFLLNHCVTSGLDCTGCRARPEWCLSKSRVDPEKTGPSPVSQAEVTVTPPLCTHFPNPASPTVP